jgi:hypothetical protein
MCAAVDGGAGVDAELVQEVTVQPNSLFGIAERYRRGYVLRIVFGSAQSV